MKKNLEKHFEKWAEDMYGDGSSGRNIGFEKKALANDFTRQYHEYRPVLTMKVFKRLLLIYCEKKGYFFNPHRTDGLDNRDKSNGREYYFVCDNDFDASNLCRLNLVRV